MTSWTPDPTGISKIVDLLHGGISTDNDIQRKVQQDLLHLSNTIAEYPCYLIHILSPASNQSSSTRIMAGYALKSYLITNFNQIQPMILSYLKSNLLLILGDLDTQVNKVTGTLISFLLSNLKSSAWPEVSDRLVQLLSSYDHDHPAFLAALSTLYKGCEDDADDLILSPNQPLHPILPIIIQLVRSPVEKIAVLSISIMTELMHGETPLIEQSMDTFLNELFARALEDSVELRKAVCAAICRIFENRADKLEPLLNNVIGYMLDCTKSPNGQVALEACEFWLILGESDTYIEALGAILNQLVPVLLQRMVYSEIEILELGGDNDDAHIPDADQEIKPRHYHGKNNSLNASMGHLDITKDMDTNKSNDKLDHSNASDADEDSDDEEEADVASSWTLRKCAAATLDMISGIYQNEILEMLLPQVNQCLSSAKWLERESGVLALGAVAEGCMEGMTPHLPQLIPYLLDIVIRDRPLVRSIACWTLGRYAHFIIHPKGLENQSPGNQHHQYLPQLVDALTQNCLHRNKKVQEASCSALATLEEAAGSLLAPYLPQILPVCGKCMHDYQRKNLVVLYDCIGTLAESLTQNELRNPSYANIIIEPLLTKFQHIPNLNRDLLPLFECLAAVATGTGMAFANYAKPVLERCLQLIHQAYVVTEQMKSNPTIKEPEPDFFIVALDLMGGIISGLGPSSESLVFQHQSDIMDALKLTLSHPLPSVRQSALGLFGDLVINSYVHIKPYTHDLLATAIPLVQMVEEKSWMRLANNAVWVCAELTSRMGNDMVPYVSQLWERILGILCNQYGIDCLPPMLADNCALAAGRLGHISPDILAKDLSRFGPVWCQLMSMTREGPEKEASYLGLIKVLHTNPNAMVPHLPQFIQAILNYNTISQATEEQFQNVLSAYKSMLGNEHWHQCLQSLPPQVVDVLLRRFQI